mmetsp:Transcript_1024/g.1877  ORF Transcript_1024/g.1877 Transcript_1024/m.1877 type:complete len:109 (-) Transcript_1024:976-1302(-)
MQRSVSFSNHTVHKTSIIIEFQHGVNHQNTFDTTSLPPRTNLGHRNRLRPFFPEPFPFATLPENNLHDGGQPPFTTLILKCLPPLARNSSRSASDANVQHLSQAPLWE